MKNDMRIRSVDFRMKSLSDAGEFEGYASVFGNEDSYGDIIEPGAFAKTLKEHGDDNPIPILWQHDTYAPIGTTIEAMTGSAPCSI